MGWEFGVGRRSLDAKRWALFVVGSRLGVKRFVPLPFFCIYYCLPSAFAPFFVFTIYSCLLSAFAPFCFRFELRVRGDLFSCPNEVSYQAYSSVYEDNDKSNLYRLWNLRSKCFHEILFHCLLK